MVKKSYNKIKKTKRILMKTAISFFLLLLFIGCANTQPATKKNINKIRFQAVPAQKAILLQKSSSCAICGMKLPMFFKTNHVADTKDGTKQYCSLHCVVKDNEFNKTDLKNLRVVDIKTLKFIPALDAYYVVGSKKPATMSRVSKYAFANKSDAKSFAKKFGGKVMKFYDAYNIATKDFTSKK
jgi:hypothetical protein